MDCQEEELTSEDSMHATLTDVTTAVVRLASATTEGIIGCLSLPKETCSIV